MGSVFYAWVHHVGVPSGRSKRQLLIMVLVLPMVTAAIPGRDGVAFAERLAWFNSARLGAVPLAAGLHLYHAGWLIAVVLTLLTIWQEVIPSFRTPRATTAGVPEWLSSLARGRPGWETCTIALTADQTIMLATHGRPGRPWLVVSQGALSSLSPFDLGLATAHEHAHWVEGRWWKSHLLFAARLLQCYHPTALWVFREYCSEEEIACDAVAVAGTEPAPLVRLLMRVYQETNPRDVSARSALRKRVEVLMAGGPQDSVLPPGTAALAAGVMLLVLPWIV
jgi:Zn-dependent protease with chaperone function